MFKIFTCVHIYIYKVFSNLLFHKTDTLYVKYVKYVFVCCKNFIFYNKNVKKIDIFNI